MMPGIAPLAPVLAADDFIVGVIIFLLTIVGWVINLISSKNQKGPPVANRPRIMPPQDGFQLIATNLLLPELDVTITSMAFYDVQNGACVPATIR